MSQLCLKAQRKTHEAWEEKDLANQTMARGRAFKRRDGPPCTPCAQEEDTRRRSSSLDQVLLEQSLVEQQWAGRGTLLLQAEDQVPEVDSRDPLPHLPTGGRGGAGRAWRASGCLEHNETMHRNNYCIEHTWWFTLLWCIYFTGSSKFMKSLIQHKASIKSGLGLNYTLSSGISKQHSMQY